MLLFNNACLCVVIRRERLECHLPHITLSLVHFSHDSRFCYKDKYMTFFNNVFLCVIAHEEPSVYFILYITLLLVLFSNDPSLV